MAEREGFEPSRRLPAYTLSRRAPSTTRPPLRIFALAPAKGSKRSARLSMDCFGKAREGMPRPGHSSQPNEQGITPRSGWRTIQISCAGSSADIGIGQMVQRKVAPLRKLMAAIRFGVGYDPVNQTCKGCGSVGSVSGGNHRMTQICMK